jgi:FKBP-type peptidyl-prolyl cis-trans isomerase (trigger factor)
MQNEEKKRFVGKKLISSIHSSHNEINQTSTAVTICIGSKIVLLLFERSALALKKYDHSLGFKQGETPIDFIKKNYTHHLLDHVQEFLFNYCIMNTLCKEAREKHIIYLGDPQLIDIKITANDSAHFLFILNTAQPIKIDNSWHTWIFKTPKRKNYKDIDRQVECFIEKETENLEKYNQNQGIDFDDWVGLTITLVDENSLPLFKKFSQNFWLKISEEHAENSLRDLLLGRNKGDSFVVQDRYLQNYFSPHQKSDYQFHITITNHLPHSYFCFDGLSSHFQLTTREELHNKLIEVFSYRHDVSQRRATAEQILSLFLNKHHIEIPQSFLHDATQRVLKIVQQNPDYDVYRKQKEFKLWIAQLAEKQLKESVLIDALSYHESINITQDDLIYFLNNTLRSRTREFLYFEPYIEIRDGLYSLIPEEALLQSCLREKTLNFVTGVLQNKFDRSYHEQ